MHQLPGRPGGYSTTQMKWIEHDVMEWIYYQSNPYH